ncbi:MAG: cobalamin-dependent protein [Pseudomonadota bacterium]
MASVIGAGTAALRKVIANPLKRRMREGHLEGIEGANALSGDSINAIIESEIVPKLLMAHASHGSVSPDALNREINPIDASRFAELPLSTETSGLIEEVNGFIDRGASLDTIYLELLAPSARKLGQLWEEDECDFVDVTMGLWRLQEVMREIASRTPRINTALSAQRSILVSPLPGDQHSFGAIMIEDVFSRAGWSSELLVEPERRELLAELSRKSFDVLGLTISRDCPSAAVQHVINATRGVSANPNIAIMIGGRMVNENPGMVEEVGADGTAVDARGALSIAEELVTNVASLSHLSR